MPLRLNLGCGDNHLPGWINIDLLKSADLSMDLRDGLPFLSNSCEFIAAIHVLEHFSPNEVINVVRESYRVLSPGGTLRIGVPNLLIFAQAYVDQNTAFYDWPGPHDGLRFAGETLADRFMFMILGGGHQYSYDSDSLKHLLQVAGFQIVHQCEYQVGKTPDLHLLDNRPEFSLFVEAIKGQSSLIPADELRRIHNLKNAINRRRRYDKWQQFYRQIRAVIRIRGRFRAFLSHIGITRVRLSPPTLEDIARRNTLEAYDEIWGNDEHVQSYLGADRLIFYQRIAKLCVKYKPKRVLDVGCGTGDFMRIFKRRLIDDRIITNFYGLDYSKNAITRATGRFPEGSFLIGDGYNLCYADSSLDLVVAMEILEHVSRPKDMVREFIRVCEPGGRVVITVPDGGYDNWPGHQNFWTEDTLRQMLVDIGLQGIEKISENKVLVATLLSK